MLKLIKISIIYLWWRPSRRVESYREGENRLPEKKNKKKNERKCLPSWNMRDDKAKSNFFASILDDWLFLCWHFAMDGEDDVTDFN